MSNVRGLYLRSKQDGDQKVASLNPTWESLGGRERMKKAAARARWKEQMERRRVDRGRKRRKRRGEEGKAERMASRCIINCSETSWSAGADCPSIRSSVVPAAALLLYFCAHFFLNTEAWLTPSFSPPLDSSLLVTSPHLWPCSVL